MNLFKLFCIFIILIFFLFFYKLTYIINNSKKNNQENYLDNIKIIKEFGKGWQGTVYLVEDINSRKKYAMKVEQIFKKDMKETSESMVWREIDFSNNLCWKYPEQFMQIYRYENKKCNYVHKFDNDKKFKDLKHENIKTYNFFNNLYKSPFCSIKLFSIVDEILENILYKIDDKKIILDLFIQVIYISYLMNKEGYYHCDLHPRNIGIIYVKNNTTISIFGKDIPTHGYLLQAIDYGKVLHNKYIMKEEEKEYIKYKNDLELNFYRIIFKIMLKDIDNKKITKIVPISKEDDNILNKFLVNFEDNTYFKKYLYKIIFFDKFQDQINIKNKVELFDFIPIESVIFIVENYYNLENILIHLIYLSLSKNNF
jgi:hypothetical protein